MLHMTVFNCGKSGCEFTEFSEDQNPRNHPAASWSVVHLCRRACPTQSGKTNPPILSTMAHESDPSAASTTKKPSQNIGQWRQSDPQQEALPAQVLKSCHFNAPRREGWCQHLPPRCVKLAKLSGSLWTPQDPMDCVFRLQPTAA